MNPAFRYRLHVSYDGTHLSGWQVQPGHRTVQGDLEKALAQITGAHVRVESSGRTDAGVHAREQVAHFELPKRHDRPESLLRGINALLGGDVRVLKLTRTSSNFHARFSTTGKEYRYFIHNDKVWSPCHRFYRTWIRQPLDVDSMRVAAKILEGHHDFVAFTAKKKPEIEDTCRTLYRLAVMRKGAEIVIVARGDGFLYKMVRSLAGFLIRVGKGELPASDTRDILDSKLRTARVPTAPAAGLFLWRVHYGRPRQS